MTEIKFDSAALKANRNPLRRTGSSLGGQFYRINKFAGNKTCPSYRQHKLIEVVFVYVV